MKILVVDDEQPLREALERALKVERYEVETLENGALALERMKTGGNEIDAVVLDVLMPGIDGLEVCRRLRASGDKTPVLMLTARIEVEDRVAGLDAGADDYVTKPFDLEELLARLRALLRRAGSPSDQVLRFADLVLDPVAHEVRRADRLIEVTRTEFLLLELFLLNPRQVLSRSIIFERSGGTTSGPAPTRSRSTSATCGARRNPEASPA